MSDFDFDELDQAVSNVLGDKTARREAEGVSKNSDSSAGNSADAGVAANSRVVPARPAPTTPPAENEAVKLDTPTETAPASQPQPTTDTPSVPPAIVKPRSSINRVSPPVTTSEKRGGVIDIMAPPSRRPTRESSLVAPSRLVEEEKTTPQAPAETVAAPAETVKPTVSDEGSFERFETLSRSGFDFDDTNDTSSPVKPAESSTAPAEPDQPAVSASAEPEKKAADEETVEPIQSNQSPFLSGAKVEKRPLGSYSSFTAPADQAVSSSQPSPEAVPEDEPVTDMPAAEPITPVPAVDKQPVVDKPKPDIASADFHPDHMLSDGHEHQSTKPETNAAPASSMDAIPQQYKVTDQKQDETPRPVFDTKEYHTATVGQEAKPGSSGNGLLIASLVLLVVALAAAAGIYFYGNQLGL